MKARDIIGESIATHPDAFRAAMISQAETHDDAARSMRDLRAVQGAIASRNACLRVYDAIGANDVDEILAECGPMVIALNAACKLQGIPPHIRTSAAFEWQERAERIANFGAMLTESLGVESGE